MAVLVVSLMSGGVAFSFGFNGGRELKLRYGSVSELVGEYSMAITYLCALSLGLTYYLKKKK